MRANPNDPPAAKSKFGIQTPDQKPQEYHDFSSFASHAKAKEKFKNVKKNQRKFNASLAINIKAVGEASANARTQPTVGSNMIQNRVSGGRILL